MSDQQSLFGSETQHPNDRLENETSHIVSHMPDKRPSRKMRRLVDHLEAIDDPVQRARLAGEIRELADRLFASSVIEANRSGHTWREIGAALGIPFQTLYRRYGGFD